MAPSSQSRRRPRLAALLLLLLLLLLPLLPACAATPECPTFDASRLRLVSFDVFGALMSTVADLRRNLLAALPTQIDEAGAALAADELVSHYGGYFGKTFDPATQQPQPFPFVVREGLERVLAVRAPACGAACAPGGAAFEELASFAWARLTPYADVAAAFDRLVQAGLELAALSNADALTLGNATAVFALADGTRIRLFGSDYPVGAFKPLRTIYEQVLNAGFAADEILHVAGGAADAAGARAAGLASALVRGAPDAAAGAQPCFLMQDLSELPGFLSLDASPSPSPSPSASASASPSPSPSPSASPSPSMTSVPAASASSVLSPSAAASNAATPSSTADGALKGAAAAAPPGSKNGELGAGFAIGASMAGAIGAVVAWIQSRRARAAARIVRGSRDGAGGAGANAGASAGARRAALDASPLALGRQIAALDAAVESARRAER